MLLMASDSNPMTFFIGLSLSLASVVLKIIITIIIVMIRFSEYTIVHRAVFSLNVTSATRGPFTACKTKLQVYVPEAQFPQGRG